MMILGSVIAILAPKQSENIVSYLGQLTGSGLAIVTYLLIMLGVLAINLLDFDAGINKKWHADWHAM